MNRKLFWFGTVIAALILMSSCKERSTYPFKIMCNFDLVSDTLLLNMDMQDVVYKGIEIPSKSQNADGFEFQFEFSNYKKGNYFYKIYYQNESYKFDESDPLAYENFYGSWEDTDIEFKPITSEKVVDYIRIVGNPRNEAIYFGAPLTDFEVTDEKISALENAMRHTPEWFASIKEKAERQKRTVETQLFLDALWMIDSRRNEGNENHRWKRNPRTGCYSFLLVICDEVTLSKIPDYIKNIALKNPETNQFVNPYAYFAAKKERNIIVQKSAQTLRTRAILSPENGIYVDPLSLFDKIEVSKENPLCNDTHEQFENALFEQFFHHINKDYLLPNIPVTADVYGDNYTQEEYDANVEKYDNQRINDHPYISDNPCKTVSMPDNYIQLVNPGNAGNEKPRKESVGVKTRVGFTYGKYIGKIKFPKILNDHNVSNGLTNAFWLIYDSDKTWNARRESKNGYVHKSYRYESGIEPEKNPTINYAEIDIEIVKASRVWPHQKKNSINERDNSDVMFCCTNWDMSCADPKNYGTETNVQYDNQKFYSYRWHKYYNATTIKTPIPNNELFDPEYYYYEIEWKPNEIIWRVGASLDNMKVMGYMNDTFTAIPNNQMRAVVTQEYHYGEWWPPIVWDQKNIPYPKNDIVGKVYEIIIE
ncbi:MAG: hypothetical protein FWF09_06790 [Bacteroidales bacterium]|nr:hypothetical protein [Bacteroidales bacterium]